jgi:uncharacterized protein
MSLEIAKIKIQSGNQGNVSEALPIKERSVIIRNLTKGSILADRAWEASSFWQRFRGLLGRQSLGSGEGLYLHPCSSIHSFFMRFSIDALFIDAEKKVLLALPRMKPWRVSKIVLAAVGVIELPAGTLERTQTMVGDLLELKTGQRLV